MAIDYKHVFIDTAPFIYYIEKDVNNPQYSDCVKLFLAECYNNKVMMTTSAVTVEEYLVFPYSSGMMKYATLFDSLMATLVVNIVPIDDRIARIAARIRAEHKSFKSMDALQLATAVECGCDAFLTNDKRLLQFDSIECVLVDSLIKGKLI